MRRTQKLRYHSIRELYVRMDLPTFQDLSSLIEAHINKDTRCRRAITPGERLCVTLRFL